MAKKKFYAVLKGREPGIYTTWDDCKQQVDHFPCAVYKSFLTKAEAEAFLGAQGSSKPTISNDQQDQTDRSDYLHIYVDGSYMKGQYGWAFVVYDGPELVFSDYGLGEQAEAVAIRNVAGELAATMRAIKWAKDHLSGKQGIVIHHDYMGISAWAEGSWQAKNPFTQAYAKFVKPALQWVRFQKVQGHSGVEGNELADKLAKQAIEEGKKNPVVE